MKLSDWLVQKLNPAQVWIAQSEGTKVSSEPEYSYKYYYENLEVVNRAINMIVDDVAEIRFSMEPTKKVVTPIYPGLMYKTVNKILNQQPNPYQDIHAFTRNLVLDLLFDGNAFIYFDGMAMYQLPAAEVQIVPDPKEYIKHFIYNDKEFFPSEIIHIKDNNPNSIYRGASRLKPALRTMTLMRKMRDFQDNFFNNGAVPGLVISTPDVLSTKIKERMKAEWSQQYRPQSGGRRPMILDGGMKVEPITSVNFQELDFASSVDSNEKIVLKALGVPPLLIDSGNNANIRPNHRLYYLETIIPIIKKFASAYQLFFGYEIWEDITGIPALQPELKDEAAYYSTLVNGGIITPNEGRYGLGKEPIDGGDEIRVPANIAGSAVDSTLGGSPGKDNNE